MEGEGETLEGQGDEQALDLDKIFNEDAMEEKTSALANESDNSGAEFFAPSASSRRWKARHAPGPFDAWHCTHRSVGRPSGCEFKSQ